VNAFKKTAITRILKKFRDSRFLFFGSFFLLGSVFAFLIYKATTPVFPSASCPIVFYANQSRHDLKLLFCQAIHSAQHALWASFYGVTDRDIIAALSKKASSGIDVSIEYDRKASLSLKKLLPSQARITARRSKGLMHRKILIVDQAYLFLGSANWTSSSLQHHSNSVIGLYAPPLAHFLSHHPDASPFFFELESSQAECWLLPDTEQQALKRLLSLIQEASQTIRIAMFTLTHPQIAHALADAVKRGVHVSVIIDYYSARGASNKTVDLLQQKGVAVFLSQGPQLFHHKWAIIDHNTFAMGSANWTKAAFTKNEDFLFILSPLTKDQKKYLNGLWEILELEANRML